ncbi:hypothetical protein Voja6_00140 [Pseudomonas phage vB_PpuM-Voja-6]
MPLVHAEIVVAAALPPVKINDRIIVNYGDKSDPYYYTVVITEFSKYRGKDSIKVLFDDDDVAMYYAMMNMSGIIGRAAILTARTKPIPASQLSKWVVPEDFEKLNPDTGRSTVVRRYVDQLTESLGLDKVKASPNGKDVFILYGDEDSTYGKLRKAFSELVKTLQFKEVAKGTLDSARGVIHQFFFADPGDKNYAVYRSYEDDTFAIYIGSKTGFRKEFTLLKDKSTFRIEDYTSLDKIKAAMTSLGKKELDALKGLASGDVQRITASSASGSITDTLPLVIAVDKSTTSFIVTMAFKAGTASAERLNSFARDVLNKAVNGTVEFAQLMASTQETGVPACPTIQIGQWAVKSSKQQKPNPKFAGDVAEQAEKILEAWASRQG